MGRTLQVGLIGTGSISQSAHIPAWSEIDDVEIVGLADPDPAARSEAEACTRSHGMTGVSSYESYDDLLRAQDLDFVDVTIPSGEAKTDAIRAALSAGVDVTCQKPFVRDYDAGRELVETAAREDCVLSVNQQARYAGAFAAAKSMIDDGRLGDLRTIRLASDLQFADEDRWLRFGIHNFDLLRHWTGRMPNRVNAWHRRQTEDDRWVYATWLDFGDDLMVQVWDDLASSTTLRWQFRVGGTEGTVRGHEAYMPDMVPAEVVYTPANETTEEKTPITDDYVPNAFVAYFERFVAALRGNGPVPTSGDDNLESLRIAFAARRSAERGDWVDLDSLPH